MATHDYVIANGTGSAVRSDLNNALAAIVSNNSGSSEPSTKYAYQWWADTTTGQLKLRNSSNNAWVTIFELDGTMLMEDGTVSAPGLAFASDLNTGFFRSAADTLAIATAGTHRVTVDSSGKVGINQLPTRELSLHSPDNNNAYIHFTNDDTGETSSDGCIVGLDGNEDLNINNQESGKNIIFRNNGERMRLDSSGRLLVGHSTNSLATPLSVAVTALANISDDAGAISTGFVRIHDIGTQNNRFCGLEIRNKNNGDARILNVDSGTTNHAGLAFVVDNGSTPVEAMRLDSSSRLLIGTTSHLDSTAGAVTIFNSSSGGRLALGGNPSGAGSSLGEIFGHWNGNKVAGLVAMSGSDTTNKDDGELRFYTSSSGPAATERMRITASGAVSLQNAAYFSGTNNGDSPHTFPPLVLQNTSNNTAVELARFRGWNGTTTGQITTRVNLTQYLTSSDYRLKENVVDIADGITRVKQLSPKRFNFTADPNNIVDGFLAHEAQSIVPEAIYGTRDQVDDHGEPVYQGIDQSKLVPLLTAALQEAIAKIETLETKVAALEAG